MNADSDESRGDSKNPDRAISRDVSDLQGDARVLSSEIQGLEKRIDDRIDEMEKRFATKEDLANRQSDSLRLAMTLLIPVLAAALGALAVFMASSAGQ